MLLQKFKGGGQDALQNYVFTLGGQCPPALPVADPMPVSDVNRLKNLNRLKMSFNRLID